MPRGSRRGIVPASEASFSNLPTLETSSAAISNARRWTIIALLFVSSFINYVHRAAVSVALPMISLELKMRPLQKGWLLYSFFVSYALMGIPMGRMVDRFNLRWLVAGMFSLWCLSCGLMGFAGSLATLVALRISLGIGESIYFPGGNKIVGLLFAPADRGLPSGLFRLRHSHRTGPRGAPGGLADFRIRLAMDDGHHRFCRLALGASLDDHLSIKNSRCATRFAAERFSPPAARQARPCF